MKNTKYILNTQQAKCPGQNYIRHPTFANKPKIITKQIYLLDGWLVIC